MFLASKSPSLQSYTAQTLSSVSAADGMIEAVTDSTTVEDYTLGEQYVIVNTI